MKLLTALTLVFMAVCGLCWVAAFKTIPVLADFNIPFPRIVQFVFSPRPWMLLCPLPWVIWLAWLWGRGELSPRTKRFYTVTVTLAGMILAGMTGDAFLILFQKTTTSIH